MVNHMPQSITASLNYLIDTGEKPVNAPLGVGPEEVRLKVWNYDARDMSLLNGGVAEEEFDLDVYGFAFVQHPIQTKNFYDVEELKSVYYPEIEQLIKDQMGVLRLLIFDHTLRNGDDDLRARLGTREQVKSVQNDYTEWSGPQYVRDLLADEAEGFLSRRMAVVQAWRAINQPIQINPLAICSARSLASADLLTAERHHQDQIGEIYQFTLNPDHDWYYLQDMARDEAIVFKVYDSAQDGRTRFTVHTSFDDPSIPADAPPPESIKIRTIAFVDEAA